MDTNKHEPFALAEMLIRKPIAEVFEAFVNPDIITKIWFTKSSGRLEAGKEIIWTWEMFNHSAVVFVKSIVPNETIIFEWGGDQEKTTVELTFKKLNENSTFISIVNRGYKGNTEQIIVKVRDSTEGFTLVLAGLKAYLEHGIQLNLISDRFPSDN